MNITPWHIDVVQADLDDLQRRLDSVRWPDELPDSGWDYGVAAGYLAELVEYWRTGYDWRYHERRLNAFPQFTTEIDGQNVHFVHVRSASEDATPLIMSHGWPSTIADLVGLAAPLAEAGFHVVIPSLPGFGFSGPTRERGWGITRIAAAWDTLMRRLGYDRYLAHGGDFGSLISSELARVAPESLLGVHTNALVSASTVDWTADDPLAGLTEDEIAAAQQGGQDWQERSGYAAIQSTRPQTLAYALTDSPVGLLAWHLEWFVDYDPARGVQDPVDRDAILTNATIFWLTRTAGSAARLYKDAGDAFYGGAWSAVPAAVAVFPGDGTLRTLAERMHNVVRWTEYDRGGHFASLQAPDLVIADLCAFRDQLGARQLGQRDLASGDGQEQ